MTSHQKCPVVLIIRDGWGNNPFPEYQDSNAVHLAKTPVDDWLRKNYPHVLIHTSGEDVGLPAGVIGNSEVGHQNIGAGRVVNQELLRISMMIRSGEFNKNDVLLKTIAKAKNNNKKLHLMGLASDAGVHSSLEHLYGLLSIAKSNGLTSDQVYIHNFSDGRDCQPDLGIKFCEQIEEKTKEIGIGQIASVIGRFYAMDRDDRWERVEVAYELLTEGIGSQVKSPKEAYSQYYEKPDDENRKGDEFIRPTVVVDKNGKPLPRISDGDAVIFYNFRGDRPRELTRAFCVEDFPYQAEGKDGIIREMGFKRNCKMSVNLITMTEYEQGLPVEAAVKKPPKMRNTLGAYLSEAGLKQFRCAETEKFPHVTFFFNDYRDDPYEGEERQIIASPRDVTTYDQKPEMSALGVTDEVLRRIDTDEYDLIVINYANGDMVGHTGSLTAAIKAVEAVDVGVGKIVNAVLSKGGRLIVSADHGNCEQMIDPNTGGIHTAHTNYDVDLILVDDQHTGNQLRTGGRLADIAPTIVHLLGLPQPYEMTGESLI